MARYSTRPTPLHFSSCSRPAVCFPSKCSIPATHLSTNLSPRQASRYIYLFIYSFLLDTPLLFPNRTKSQSAAVRSIRSNNAIDGWKKDLFLHKFITNNYGLFPIDRHSILRGLTWKHLGRLNPALFIAREYVYRRLER